MAQEQCFLNLSQKDAKQVRLSVARLDVLDKDRFMVCLVRTIDELTPLTEIREPFKEYYMQLKKIMQMRDAWRYAMFLLLSRQDFWHRFSIHDFPDDFGWKPKHFVEWYNEMPDGRPQEGVSFCFQFRRDIIAALLGRKQAKHWALTPAWTNYLSIAWSNYSLQTTALIHKSLAQLEWTEPFRRNSIRFMAQVDPYATVFYSHRLFAASLDELLVPKSIFDLRLIAQLADRITPTLSNMGWAWLVLRHCEESEILSDSIVSIISILEKTRPHQAILLHLIKVGSLEINRPAISEQIRLENQRQPSRRPLETNWGQLCQRIDAETLRPHLIYLALAHEADSPILEAIYCSSRRWPIQAH